MINRVFLLGRLSERGCKLSYTPNGKPQTSFTLLVSEPGPAREYVTYIPVVIVGPRAESVAEVLEPHDLIALEGRLSYRSGKTKDAPGSLSVVGFEVLRVQAALAEAQP